MTWDSPAPQSRTSVQRVNQTLSIYPHYSLPLLGQRARLPQQHPCVVSHRCGPPGISLQTTRTKGVSDQQQDESGADTALFQNASMRSSGSRRSPVASVPIFCRSRSSRLKGSSLCPVNTIRRASRSASRCISLLGTKCPGPDGILT